MLTINPMRFDTIRFPKLLVNSFMYTFFNVVQKAIAFFLLPLYTIYLTPEDYGITNVLTSSTALLTFLYTLSVQAASTRFHFKYSKNPILVKKIWGTNFLFIVINSFLWVLITLASYNYTLVYLIGDNIHFYPYVLVSILNCALSPAFLYYQTYLQTTQQAKLFAINNMANFLLLLVLNITFVVVFKMQALGVLLSGLIVTTIFGFYALYSLRNKIIYCLIPKLIKHSLQYSIPLIPHSLSGWLNGMLDRIFINRIVNLASVGLYSVSYQFGFIVNMLGFGLNQAYNPWFFKQHNEVEGKRRISEVADIGIAGLAIIGFFIGFFSKEILILMTNEKYHDIWESVIILVYANLFDCLYYFYVAVLFLENTKLLSCISISFALVNCLVNYFLISHFGYIGAAYSFLLIQFVKALMVYWQAKRLRPDIKFYGAKHFAELLIPLLCVFPLLRWINGGDIISMLLKAGVLIIYIVLIYVLNVSVLKKIVYEIRH